MANRRRFLQGSRSGEWGGAGGVRHQPGARAGNGQGRRAIRQAAEGGVLQCRPAGDMVRAGQAGGGILGQAVQRRGDLVRRRTGRAEAARGDRQHGLAEMGFRRHPGVRHRHADRAGQQADRRRHAGDRHGHADRAARLDQRPQLPRARQRVHGRVGDPVAGRCDRRRGHHDHDPGRAGPHRRAGPGARLPVGGEEVSEDRGAGHPARRLGRDQGRAHLGDAADQVSEDQRRLFPQRRHGACRLQRDEGAQPHRDQDRRLRRDAAGAGRGQRRPHAGDGAQSVLPHPWRRDRRRRRRGGCRREDRARAAFRRTSSSTARW